MSLMLVAPNAQFNNFVDVAPLLDYAFDLKSLYNAGVFPSAPPLVFSRESSATCYGSNGRITSVAANVPRWQHNPVTMAVEGLLHEGPGSNAARYSEDFSNAAWTKLETTVVSNAGVAPDGNMTADKLVPSTNVALHRSQQFFTVESGKRFVASAFFKPDGYNNFSIQIGGAAMTPNCFVKYNSVTGALSSGTGALRFYATPVSDGYVRLEVSGVSISAGTAILDIFVNDNAGNSTFAGDGTSGVLLFGAQFERDKQYATSYMPTTNAAATRSADVLTSSVASLLTGDFGILAEYKTTHETEADGLCFIAGLDDGTSMNRVALVIGTGTAGVAATTRSSGVVVTSPVITTSNDNFIRAAAMFSSNSFTFSAIGRDPSQTNFVRPTIITLRIGGQAAVGTYPNDGYLNGVIKRVSLYGLLVPSSTLAAKTM